MGWPAMCIEHNYIEKQDKEVGSYPAWALTHPISFIALLNIVEAARKSGLEIQSNERVTPFDNDGYARYLFIFKTW